MMDSRQRFVIIFASVAMIAFVTLAFLNSNQMGLFVSSYAIIYFALRLLFNPRMRLRLDVLGIVLLVLFVYYVAQQVALILA
ncbi:MAG TPA: hypothetical protein VFF30_19110 [Nitrososphaerales archaeon]|nr:hypothetical protein [Nitrososphaerales archaeon]